MKEGDPRVGPLLTAAEVDAALQSGARLFDAGRFWDAHEAWETGWHRAPHDERDLFQGLIHAAAACLHHQRGNAHGHDLQRTRMHRRLDPYPTYTRGLDLGALMTAIDALPPPGQPATYPRLGL